MSSMFWLGDIFVFIFCGQKKKKNHLLLDSKKFNQINELNQGGADVMEEHQKYWWDSLNAFPLNSHVEYS